MSNENKDNKAVEDKFFSTVIDGNGDEWRFTLGFKALRGILQELDVTLAQFTMLDVKFADIMGCVHMLCEDQIKERGMTKEQFYARIESVPLPQLGEALKESVSYAFPSIAEQGGSQAGGKKSPFGLGQ